MQKEKNLLRDDERNGGVDLASLKCQSASMRGAPPQCCTCERLLSAEEGQTIIQRFIGMKKSMRQVSSNPQSAGIIIRCRNCAQVNNDVLNVALVYDFQAVHYNAGPVGMFLMQCM